MVTKKKRTYTVKENIEEVALDDIMADRMAGYAKSIILNRSIPDVRDGLNPVQRRILFGMAEGGYFYNRPHKKSARIVGDVMGKYHPHGDSSIYSALIRISKPWELLYPLVDVHGNNGSIDGDEPAAMRYTEARLSKIAMELMLKNIDGQDVVPMVNNFDDSLKEPVYLPAKIPNVLINGAAGAAYAFATNIPTFNLTEVLNGAIALLTKPEMSAEEFVQYVPAPDFPTGGVISGYRDYFDTLKTGSSARDGSYKIRGKYSVERTDPKVNRIVFTEIPYGVHKTKVVSHIQKDILENKVAGLLDARDETSRTGIRLVVEISKDADLNNILGYLFKRNDLMTTFAVNMVVISDKSPRQLGVMQIVKRFNSFRKEVTTRVLKDQLAVLQHKLELTEGMLILVPHVEEIVTIIKNSSGKADAKEILKPKYNLTETQVDYIVSMPLHRVSKTDNAKYLADQSSYTKTIERLTAILGSDQLLTKLLAADYQAIIDEYGQPRRTRLIEKTELFTYDEVTMVPDEPIAVGITTDGLIKRASLRSYSSTINANNPTDTETTEGAAETTEPAVSKAPFTAAQYDSELDQFTVLTTTRQNVIYFTDDGHYYYTNASKLPSTKWKEHGVHLNTLGAKLGVGRIISAFNFVESPDTYVLSIKNTGRLKLTALTEYIRKNANFTAGNNMKVKDTEKVAAVYLVKDLNAFLTLTDTNDHSLYFPLTEVPIAGNNTAGTLGASLNLRKGVLLRASALYADQGAIPATIDYRKRGSAPWTRRQVKPE